MAFDLLIKGGKVVDGTGQSAFHADLAVDNGKIVVVEADISGGAHRVIDATDRIVAPGFIDIHTHFDTRCSRTRNSRPPPGMESPL